MHRKDTGNLWNTNLWGNCVCGNDLKLNYSVVKIALTSSSCNGIWFLLQFSVLDLNAEI